MAEAESAAPLLSSSSSSNYSAIDKSPSTESLATHDPEQLVTQDELRDRSVEDEVLPETSVLGRQLGWSSAYILVRVKLSLRQHYTA
jgi:hypothetical protein